MKIGVSTSCYYPLETERSLEEVGKAGFSCSEVFFNAVSELSPDFVRLLCDIQRHYGIEIPSIHPTMSLAESFMIFSAYERRLTEALDSFARYSEIAAQLGASYIILHGGKPNGILSDDEYCERYMKLKEVTRKNGVTVLQENVVRHRAGELPFLRAMRDILGKDAEFCLDVKQSIRCGYSPLAFLEEFGQNVKHCHISDHTETNDCMLPGNGIFDFAPFLHLLEKQGFAGACMIEVYRNAYDHYEDIQKSFNFFLKTYCQTAEKRI